MHVLAIAVLLAANPALPVRTPTPFVHEMHDTDDDARLTVVPNISSKIIFDVMVEHTEHFHDCTAKAGTTERNKVVMIFDVAPDGSVRNVGVSQGSASLASEPVVHCFAKELRTLKFPKTAKGDKGIAIPLVTYSQRRAMDGGR